MKPNIAFVGAGPTMIYTLHALVNQAARPFSATIFEEQSKAGLGTPYRPGWNDPAMLSNIASIEIPPLEETLVDWLERQAPDRLAELGIEAGDIDDHAFYPRLALGQFFLDQFHALMDRARTAGHDVEIRARCHVVDVAARNGDLFLTVRPRRGEPTEQRFDHVVLATGHQWPDDPEVRPGYFLSPWPASALAAIPATEIGIRGSSLTAIDAAVALAVSHGEFVDGDNGDLSFNAAKGADQLHIVMMSRKGLLPEADFFHPVPYEPLSICTPEAMEQLIDQANGDLLDGAFELFREELTAADPEFARSIDLQQLDLESFAERYFAKRVDADQFDWAEANLREAQRNYADHVTVPWRYSILRMHEVMALMVSHLDDAEFLRFSRLFKPIFVDDYATVPHESIKRMLALHRAGALDIMAIGDDYKIDSHRPEGGAVLKVAGRRVEFPQFIEATGQRALPVDELPFPSLRQQGIIRDTEVVNGKEGSRGIEVDEQFHPVSEDSAARRLYCLSVPFLLGRHPFIQGITSSHEMGTVVAEDLAQALGGTFGPTEDIAKVAAE